MPEISRFHGLTIHFYSNDHSPPHFHVVYGSQKAVFRIDTLEMIEGKIPKNKALLVIQWAFLHREELLEGWETARKGFIPKKIKGLN